MSTRLSIWSLLVATTSVAACGGESTPAAGPIAPTPAPSAAVAVSTSDAGADAGRQAPPPPSAAKPSPFPAVHRSTLPNGLQIATIEAHALPVVQIRVLVHAGSGFASKAGAVAMTADMLKDGGTRSMTSGELLRRVESMGANLGVSTDNDGTVLSLAITKDHLSESIALLGEVLQAPRFDKVELTKLKSRASDEAEDRARSDGQFGAMHEIVSTLFPSSSPYARYGTLPSEVAAIDDSVIRATYAELFYPKNVEVVVCGDIDAASAATLVNGSFGAWTGKNGKTDVPAAAANAAKATALAPSPATRVIVSDRPKSAQSDVFVVLPAPPRNSADWPDLRVAQQVLGGGISGRLFLDVREQRSLAYSAYARIFELANGPQATLLYAGTQTPKTAQAVEGILQNVQKIATGDIDQAETERARRYLSDTFAVRIETIGAVADLVVIQDELGLPDGYWDTYRSALRDVDLGHANAAAKKLFGGNSAPIVVVAGDAEVIAPALTRFGEVTIVDPEHEFQRTRTLPATPAGPAAPATK